MWATAIQMSDACVSLYVSTGVGHIVHAKTAERIELPFAM